LNEYEAFTIGVLTVLESQVTRPADKVRAIEAASKLLKMDAGDRARAALAAEGRSK